MRIFKKVNGLTVPLEIKRIKNYPRFSLYQVFKIKDNELIPVYKTCFTDRQLIYIFLKGLEYTEDFEDNEEVLEDVYS